MGEKDRKGEEGQGGDERGSQGEAVDVPGPEGAAEEEHGGFPPQSPLFHAEHSERYERQRLISQYQSDHGCRLIVVIDQIFDYSVTLLEDLIFDADPEVPLHLMLDTPGGDGEAALRMLRSMHSRCSSLAVIVPNQAKSAGTLLAMGADEIIMGPMSDLGPVDPQFQLPDTGELVGAKTIIDAVQRASEQVEKAPDTYAFHAALLSNVTGLMVERSKDAIARTQALVAEVLRCASSRNETQVKELQARLHKALVEETSDHHTSLGPEEADAHGLPVRILDPASRQWQLIWRLWAKYFSAQARFYEGQTASRSWLWQQ